MGIYTEYLDRQFSLEGLVEERKKQLLRISQLRGRDVLVYAADLTKGSAPISISYEDLLFIRDQLDNLDGRALDLILETPGGLGEVAEDIVKLIRDKYEDFAVIVPGWAKSAGTIITMAADEILMEPASALGPVDAQLSRQGKTFSAEALIEGMKKIKEEVEATGILNKAYIPILQGISPGELQAAENALKFAEVLVAEWLAKFKFRKWTYRESSGTVVTESDRNQRAQEIAQQLRSHSRWLTHGRSIKILDLETMGVRITDYSRLPDLVDPIRRYYTLLRMTFDTNIYKLCETPLSQVYRFITQPIPAVGPQELGKEAGIAVVKVQCGRCKSEFQIQANLGESRPIQAGAIAFPANNKAICPTCNNEIDLTNIRRQLELQSKRKVV